MNVLRSSLARISNPHLTTSSQLRNINTMPYTGTAITFPAKGPLPESLKFVPFSIDEKIEPHQLVIKALGSPVNPSDWAQIRGGYPSEPAPTKLDNAAGAELHNVGGNEGVFEVVQIGSAVTNYKVGERVLPGKTGFGTWRPYALVEDDYYFLRIDPALSVDEAATIAINPPSADQILKLYVKDWAAGDWIIQNAGNSQVAQYITQIAKSWGVKTISIVRDGKSEEEIKELIDFGATKVISESEFLKPEFITKTLPEITGGARVRLGVNSVGGATVPQLVSSLSYGGVFVTFGAISGQYTIEYSLADQLFKNITTVGYWLTATAKANPQTRVDSIKNATEWYKSKVIQLPKVSQIKYDGTLASIAPALKSSGKNILKF